MLPDRPLFYNELLEDKREKNRLFLLLKTISNFLDQGIGGTLPLAICGDWGSGKTTYIKAIGDYLEKVCGYPVVFFEAWRYRPDPDPLISLMVVLKESPYFSSFQSTFEEKILKPLLISGLFFSDVFLSKLTGRGLRDVIKLFNLVEERQVRLTSRFQEVHKCLAKIIKEILKSPQNSTGSHGFPEELTEQLSFPQEPYFVLIIDDLDRLVPEEAFKLLEALRFYFNIERTLILMGINDRVLNSYVTKVYGLDEANGEKFLEKVFCWTYEMPFAPLNKLHLRSLKNHLDCKLIKLIQEFCSHALEHLPHRKWVWLLNRLEADIINAQISKITKKSEKSEGITEGLLPLLLMKATLKELFPRYEDFSRRYPGLSQAIYEGEVNKDNKLFVFQALERLIEDKTFIAFPRETYFKIMNFVKEKTKSEEKLI